MALDPRVLEPLEREFSNSKRRQRDAQDRVDALKEDLDAWQSQVDYEADIQRAINDTLAELGEAPLI